MSLRLMGMGLADPPFTIAARTFEHLADRTLKRECRQHTEAEMQWFQDYWWVVLVAILVVPLVSIAMFARWLRTTSGLSFDEKIKSWDVFVKLVSALTVVASGAVLIGKYVDQREQEGRQQAVREERESNLRTAEFLRQRLTFDTERHQRRRKLFDEAKVLAARLANAKAPAAPDVRRFDELYDADLVGVEQPGGDVEKAMVRFRRKLRGEPGAPNDDIDQLALQLAHACEMEMKASEDGLLDQHKAIAALVAAGPEK